MKAAEEAIDAVEQNNGYATSSPEERNGIVATIRGNLKALKDGSLPRQIIAVGLVRPFTYLAKKFGDSLVGQLAIHAARAIANFFGVPL